MPDRIFFYFLFWFFHLRCLIISFSRKEEIICKLPQTKLQNNRILQWYQYNRLWNQILSSSMWAKEFSKTNRCCAALQSPMLYRNKNLNIRQRSKIWWRNLNTQRWFLVMICLTKRSNPSSLQQIIKKHPWMNIWIMSFRKRLQ